MSSNHTQLVMTYSPASSKQFLWKSASAKLCLCGIPSVVRLWCVEVGAQPLKSAIRSVVRLSCVEGQALRMSSYHTQLTRTYNHIASKEKLQGTDRNELEVNVVQAQKNNTQ